MACGERSAKSEEGGWEVIRQRVTMEGERERERTAGAYLQSTPLRPYQPLSSLDKPLLVPNQPSDLDHITCHPVFQHFRRLGEGDAPGEELDEVPRGEDYVRVEGLSGGGYCHCAREEVQGTGDALLQCS